MSSIAPVSGGRLSGVYPIGRTLEFSPLSEYTHEHCANVKCIQERAYDRETNGEMSQHLTRVPYIQATGAVLGATLAAIFVATPVRASSAAELVMYEASDCPWCETWHSEVGHVFEKTDEAQTMTLRVVDVDDPIPDDLAHVEGVVYTPTFVVLNEGKELGRILGYPGEDFFWGLLQVIMRKLPEQGKPAH